MAQITKLIKQSILSSVVILSLFSQNAFAQNGDDNLDGLVNDTKNDLLTVVGGGLAGAILGLSTLSFVDEPKEHTNNIVVGASLGIIAGVAFVALSQATRTQEYIYGSEEPEEAFYKNSKEFNTYARASWHHGVQSSHHTSIQAPYSLSYSLRF